MKNVASANLEEQNYMEGSFTVLASLENSMGQNIPVAVCTIYVRRKKNLNNARHGKGQVWSKKK